jgi:hypothetical protein
MNEDEKKQIYDLEADLKKFMEETITGPAKFTPEQMTVSPKQLEEIVRMLNPSGAAQRIPNPFETINPSELELTETTTYPDRSSFLQALQIEAGLHVVSRVDVIFDNAPDELSIIITIRNIGTAPTKEAFSRIDKFFYYNIPAGYASLDYTIRIEKEVITYHDKRIERPNRPRVTRGSGASLAAESVRRPNLHEAFGLGGLSRGALSKGIVQVPPHQDS